MTKNKQGMITIGKIGVSNSVMAAISYFISSGEAVNFYGQKTQSYSDNIAKAHKQQGEWLLGEVYFAPTPPNYQAEIEKELAKLRNLTEYTWQYDFTRIIENGYFHEDLAGVLLKALDSFKEEQKTATISLERIRWLTEQSNQTKVEHITPSPTPEELPSPYSRTAKFDLQDIEYLHRVTKELRLTPPLKRELQFDKNRSYTTNQVLFALYQYCEDENMSCTKSVQSFATALPPLINPNQTPNAIQQRIGRVNREDKDTYIGDARLKELTVEILQQTMRWNETKAKKRFDKWNGLYAIVEKAASKCVMTQ